MDFTPLPFAPTPRFPLPSADSDPDLLWRTQQLRLIEVARKADLFAGFDADGQIPGITRIYRSHAVASTRGLYGPGREIAYANLPSDEVVEVDQTRNVRPQIAWDIYIGFSPVSSKQMFYPSKI